MNTKLYRNLFLSIILTGILSACQGIENDSELSKNENLEKINEENFIPKEDILKNALHIYAECYKSNLSPDAKTYAEQSDIIKNKSIEEVHSVNDENNSLPACYIVNFKDGGYLILSGDKRVPETLAFSDEETFPSDSALSSGNEEIPLGLRYWLNDMKKAISLLRTGDLNIFDNPQKANTYGGPIWETPALTSYTAPMYTKWGQGNGYNDMCPMCVCCPTQHVPAGCGAIALGQIMRYWKHPDKFNWKSIPYDYVTPSLTYLLADLYKTTYSYTEYDCKTTNSIQFRLTNALINYQYNCTEFVPFDIEIAAENIENKRPVLLFGSAAEGGHFWVCNGYCCLIGSRLVPYADPVISYYHYFFMNWGWYGEYDGWYYMGDEFLNNSYDFQISSLKMAHDIYPLN